MKKITFGLRRKLYLASMLVTIIGAVIVCWYVITYYRVIITEDLEKRAITLAKNLAHECIGPIILKDENTLLSLVNRILKERDIIYTAIYDKDGNILVQGGPFNIENIPQSVKKKSLITHVNLVQKYLSAKENLIYDISVPLHTEGSLENNDSEDKSIDEESLFFTGEGKESFSVKVGLARIGISFKNSNQSIIIHRNKIIFINLVLYCIFLILMHFIVNSILMPISLLLKGTQKIGAGDLNYKVRIKSSDEIGQLADSFNKMVDNLNISTTSIENLNKEIMERKFAEEKLKEAYQELKEAQQQLLQSSKLSAMGQMAAGISHELNQPLTGIKGFAQILAMDLGKDSPYLTDVNNIIEQANRMDSIIQNVRFFARKSEFKLEKLNVNDPIKNAVNLLQEQLKIHSIELISELDPDLPQIYGDNNQLQQIFLNLVTNGRDAIEMAHKSEPGKIIIKSQQCKEDKYILVTFEDNGCGIHKENLENIFNPFFTTKAPNGGMGLGLSIVYRIAENHKAIIDVESEQGEFTIFKIIFPVADDYIAFDKKA
ncbi:MAG: ATP-binding protein [Candidatus Omnitrophota bacterium]